MRRIEDGRSDAGIQDRLSPKVTTARPSKWPSAVVELCSFSLSPGGGRCYGKYPGNKAGGAEAADCVSISKNET